MTKVFYILLGIVWGSVGIAIIITPKFYHSQYGREFDFSEAKWPFGIFLIVLGFLFILSSFRKKTTPPQEKVLMCKECIKPIFKKDAKNERCPICGNALEDLEGFYDRHPELRP